MNLSNKIPFFGFFVFCFFSGYAKADSVTIQFFLGGVENTPEDCVGVLVADTNSDGFNSVYRPGIVGTELALGLNLAGSDDVVVGITESTGDDFDGSNVGFADVFSGIDYGALGVAEGMPVRFFWFPTQDSSSSSPLAADVGFLSYADTSLDTGGDIAYSLPPAPGVYTLSHLTTENSGGISSLSPSEGALGPIAEHPAGGSFELGDPVSLSVTTQGDESFNFQWFRGSQGNVSNPVGSDSPNLNLDSVSYSSDFWVRVSDGNAYIDSDVASVEIAGGGVRPDFVWDPVEGAERYQLLIRRNGKNWRVFWVYGGDVTSWTPDSDLSAGVYTWFVRSWSASRGKTGWVSNSFSIGIPELIAPNGPVPDSESRPELSWTRSVGATRYQLLVKRNGAKWKVDWIEGEGTLNWRSSVDMPIGNYAFWVRPWNRQDGIGPWSIPMKFTIGMPELLSPEGQLDEGDTFPEFTWNGSSRLDRYNLLIKRNGAVWENLWIDPSSSWTSDVEFGSGSYKWWMRGWSASTGSTPWAEAKTFTIDEGAQPISPLGLTSGSARPVFEWTPEPAATWYLMHFASASKGKIFRGWVRNATSWVPDSDLVDGDYLWYVRPYGPKIGHSHWRGPFTFQMDNSGSGAMEAAPMSAPGPSITSSDLNGDSMGDLLTQNVVTGDVRFQLLQNDTLIGEVAPSIQPGDPNWKVAGHGDYDGDKDADLLWQNAETGEIVVWLLEIGGSVSGVATLDQSSLSNPVEALALADFDGDGLGDLLLKDSDSGAVFVGLVDGGAVVNQIPLSGSRSSGWDVVAVADLNEDSSADLVWQNSSTGEVEYSYLDAGNVGAVISESSLSGGNLTGRKVVSAFDINGDEQVDLILEDQATGTLSSAIVEGLSITEISNFSYQLPSSDWRVVNFGE